MPRPAGSRHSSCGGGAAVTNFRMRPLRGLAGYRFSAVHISVSIRSAILCAGSRSCSMVQSAAYPSVSQHGCENVACEAVGSDAGRQPSQQSHLLSDLSRWRVLE